MSGLVWRFAGFEYSPHKGLWKDGAQIPVGPQARQLLELLLESKGGVVSKAEIGERLWPGRPVSDDSIDRCAYLLRKPLREVGFGDLIATAYGRGLSLRATIEAFDPVAGAGSPPKCEVDGHVLDIWQTAYELAGRLTRDGMDRAQTAVLASGERNDSSPAVWALSANIAASRVTLGYLRPAEGSEIIERDGGRALELAPGFLPALSVLGWSRAVLGHRIDEGLAILDQAVGRDPTYSKARAHRSWAFARLARLDEAIQDMEEAVRVSPHDRTHLTMRAWLAFCAGDLDGCARLAEDGIRSRPDAAGLHSILGLAASLSDRHADAELAARQAVQRIPDNPISQSVLAYVLARIGRSDEAEAALAAAGGDELAPPHLFVSAARLAMGQEQEARMALRRGLAEGCPWFAFAPFDPRLTRLRPEIELMSRETATGG